jgi:signal transduction histidine kinase
LEITMQASQSNSASGEYGTSSFLPTTFADTLAAAAMERREALRLELEGQQMPSQQTPGQQMKDPALRSEEQQTAPTGSPAPSLPSPDPNPATNLQSEELNLKETGWLMSASAASVAPRDAESVRNAISRLVRDSSKEAPETRPVGAPRWQGRLGWRSRTSEQDMTQSGVVSEATTSVPPPPLPQALADSVPATAQTGVQTTRAQTSLQTSIQIPVTSPSAIAASEAPAHEVLLDADIAATLEAPVAVSPLARATVTRSPGRRASDVALATALAHDAGNLLSALSLYSELLCFSGVLHENHRHYAEDLKLLAVRSQALIERLTQLGEGVAGVPAGAGAQTDPYFDLQQAERPDSPVVSLVPAVANQDRQDKGWEDQDRERRLSDSRSLDAAFRSAPVQPLAPFVLPRKIERAEANSLVDLLMRFSSILSTLAHGALEINFGPQANLPVPVAVETIERVLVNLVRNAAEAIRQGGSVRIGVGLVEGGPTEQRSRCMALTVDDSGCGMTAEQIERVLQPREMPSAPGVDLADEGRDGPRAGAEAAAAPAEPAPARGHGLGLHIVRELVATTGGTLNIYSKLGVGSRVEVRWPIVDAAAGTGVGDEFVRQPARPAQPAGFTPPELRVMRRRLNRSRAEFQGATVQGSEFQGSGPHDPEQSTDVEGAIAC